VVIIDAWTQHPSAEFLADPVFGLAAGPGPASPATTERARA
jgi:hypothetical protein